MKSLKLLAAMLLMGSTVACSQNVAEKYWQEKVVQRLSGQEYVHLRVEIDEYSICNGKEFGIRPTDTLDLHLTPEGFYLKDNDRYKLITEDSIFVYYFKDGYYTYGRTTKLKSRFEKAIYGQLFRRSYDLLMELLPFYLEPKDKKSFKVREFTYMDYVGSSVVLRYSTRKPWKDKFYDGVPYENSESIVAWVDDSSGIITRVRRTIHMTSEGIAPADEIVDMRISDINFGKVDIDESLYRKHPSKDTTIAFFNMNKEEFSPSNGIIVSPNEIDLDVLLDGPLINAGLDTTILRGIEGWVLVDIIGFHCAPCIQFTKQMEKERQELGYRRLEHEGIKVMCVIPHITDTATFTAFVERHKISDIAYSAPALDGLVKYVPDYILLSPDKQIVFRSSSLGKEYEKLLKAKKKFTRR